MREATTEMEEIATLAHRIVAGLEAGDRDAVKSCYAPDVDIWHNTDGKTQSLEENLKVLDGFFRFVEDRRYEDLRVDIFPGGFVQQHRLTGTLPGGKKLDWAACIICRVRNGLITRLDEYMDSAGMPGL